MFFNTLTHGLRGGVILLGLIHLQCSWTPEVKTPIFADEQGSVALRTSEVFRTPPAHPATLSQVLLQKILNGLRHTREAGILQELLNSSSSQPSPVFSESQINFLVPHLSLALSQATQEELVTFTSLGHPPHEALIKGNVAIFHPHIIFLTIETSKDSSGAPYVLPSQRNAFRQFASLSFLKPEALLPPATIQTLIDLPPHAHEIAINYETLLIEETHESAPASSLEEQTDNPVKSDSGHQHLEEEIQQLREKIEKQQQELQRLQRSNP